MKVRKAELLLFVAFVGGLLVLIATRLFLPERYFADSVRIAELIERHDLAWGGSYGGSAALYGRLLGGRLAPTWLVGLTNFTAAYGIFLWVYKRTGRQWSPFQLFWVCSWIGLAALYMGMYSKETFTFFLSTCVLWASVKPSAIRSTFVVIIFLLYSLFVREYWALILALFISFKFLFTRDVHWVVKLLAMGIIALAMSSAFKMTFGLYLSDARVLLNATRLGRDDIRTMVHNAVANKSVFHDLINIAWAWLSFAVPISVLRFGAPQHVAFALWQITNLAMLWITCSGYYGNLAPARRKAVLGCFAYLAAFTYVHAAFEGDFGSYVRHQIAIAPVFTYLILLRFQPMIEGRHSHKNRKEAIV